MSKQVNCLEIMAMECWLKHSCLNCQMCIICLLLGFIFVSGQSCLGVCVCAKSEETSHG